MKKFSTIGTMIASVLMLSGCPATNDEPQAPAPETNPAATAPLNLAK